MSNIKVGDWVRSLSGINASNGGPKCGEIFQVTIVSEPWIGFKLPENRLSRSLYGDDYLDITQGRNANWGINYFERLEGNFNLEVLKVLYGDK